MSWTHLSPRRFFVFALAGTLAAGASQAAPPPKSIPFADTGPFLRVDTSGAHRQSLNRLWEERNRRREAAGASAVSRDEGDVAVIVDQGSILLPPEPESPFDLPALTSLRLTPSADGFGVEARAAAVLDAGWGPRLSLGDDDASEVEIPFAFPFFGSSYDRVWVSADGYVTFGARDEAVEDRDAARLLGGPPRIAAWLSDLDPSAGGEVHADPRADRLVITWSQVPAWGTAEPNTFQAVLHRDGSVELTYGEMAARFGVVGVAPGGDRGPLREVDLSAALSFAPSSGATLEEFAPARVLPVVDVFALSREFYRTHDDHYDFLVLFTDFPTDLQGGFAFNQPIKNFTSGFGRFAFLFDLNPFFGTGSAGELESIVHMNNIHLYWPDAAKLVDPPIKKFLLACDGRLVPLLDCQGPHGVPGAEQVSQRARWFGTLNGDLGGHGSFTLGLNSAMSVMAQETGHRWLAFPFFIHPTKGLSNDSFDLMGRAFAHWSFFFNVRVASSQFPGAPRSSGMEGNAIADLGSEASLGMPFPCTGPGESLFTTEPDELIDGFTELDQYMMGLRLASEVAPFWYVDEPRSPLTGESLESLRFLGVRDDVLFCGRRVDLTVEDLVAFGTATSDARFGPRLPALGDEVDAVIDGQAVDVKTMAFILLVRDEPGAQSDAVRQVETFRRTWESYGNGPATSGRGRFDTRLSPTIH